MWIECSFQHERNTLHAALNSLEAFQRSLHRCGLHRLFNQTLQYHRFLHPWKILDAFWEPSFCATLSRNVCQSSLGMCLKVNRLKEMIRVQTISHGDSALGRVEQAMGVITATDGSGVLNRALIENSTLWWESKRSISARATIRKSGSILAFECY